MAKGENDCVFCKIVKGEIQRQGTIYEDDKTIAFLDISPATPKGGHTLVIPKKHYELITEIPEDELIALSKTLQKVVKLLLKYGEGVNILQNNKKVAGQFVPHVHFHVIPRFKNDGIKIEEWPTFEYKENEMKKIAEKISKEL